MEVTFAEEYSAIHKSLLHCLGLIKNSKKSKELSNNIRHKIFLNKIVDDSHYYLFLSYGGKNGN